jgi:SpoVK/Ycf46/Vps4 family AAA+-type ATPase
MDSAMISRFDRVIPFLLPTPEEREEILRALAGYLKIDYALGTNLADFLDSLEELTGREIEIILRRAIEIAQATKITSENLKMAIDDFKPNHDPSQYRLQALLAIQATNLRHFLPDDIPYADILENGRVDPKKLDESIKSLKGSNWA